jgi:hypothetical protein
MNYASHTERLRARSESRSDAVGTPHPHRRQSFHHAQSSMGAVGHWIRTAGLLSPLVIGELVEDPKKKWRWVRIASIATTLVSEGLYTNKVRREREHMNQMETELSY